MTTAQVLLPRAPKSIRLTYPKNTPRLTLGLPSPTSTLPPSPSHPLEISISIPSLLPPKSSPTKQISTLLKTSFSLINGNTSSIAGRKVLMRPFCVILSRSGGSGAIWEMLGRTETVEWDEGSEGLGGVRFVAKLKVGVGSDIERMRELRVEVWDRKCKSDKIEDQRFVGVGGCCVEDVVNGGGWVKEVVVGDLGGRVGRVRLGGEVIRRDGLEVKGKVAVGVEMAGSVKGGMRCFYVLSRELPCGDFTPVYRSEVLDKGEKRFKPISRSVEVLAAGSEDKLLRVELFKFDGKGEHCALGFAQASIGKLKKMSVNGNLLWWPSKYGLHIGRVVLTHSRTGESDGKNVRSEFCFRVTK